MEAVIARGEKFPSTSYHLGWIYFSNTPNGPGKSGYAYIYDFGREPGAKGAGGLGRFVRAGLGDMPANMYDINM